MKKLLALTAMLAIVAGCSGGSGEQAEPTETGKPVVYTTNYPLQYFVERIASPVVEVRFPAPGDEDPAYWNPEPDDVLAIQQADLIVLNGASYETWLKNVSLPPSRMVDSTAALEERLIPLEEATTHSHGLEGEHEHSGTAFTTWLDPILAAEQARAITVALAERWPRHAGRFESQLAELTEDLTALDTAMQEAVTGNNRLPVIFSHPVYQYLAQRYGLNARSLHWEPDQAPDETAWRDLVAILEEFPAAWMIWEERPLPQVSDSLESLGIRSVVFDPCAKTPSSGDFLSVMEENLQVLRLVFAPESPPAGG